MMKKNILTHANCFNCSIPVDGYHLTTGHILQFGENQFYLTVTPACDLVPGRDEKGPKNKPISLMKLYDVNIAVKRSDSENLSKDEVIERALSFATSKKVIFVNIDGDIRILTSIVNLYGSANPKIEPFLASNEGRFSEDNIIDLFKQVEVDGLPTFEPIKSKVIAQLRYEYALHHLMEVGSTLSRIGLDYEGITE